MSIEIQLKEAVQITEAVWAVLAERLGGVWIIRTAYHLGKPAQNELMNLMSRSSIDTWLCGALSGGHNRSSSIPQEYDFKAKRFFAFPISGKSQIILVGADDQTAAAQRIWKLTVSFLSAKSSTPEQPFLPDLQSGLAFDLPIALEKVLGAFVQTVTCQGAWLAIRRGESLDIQAEWDASDAKGLSLLIDSNPLLRRVNRSLSEVIITRGQPNWDNLPYGTLKSGTKIWVCLPLVIGQRLIGVVALWAKREFTLAEWGQLRELIVRISPSVEVVVTFSEMGAHLRRLAMLNDFVLTISTAQGLDQIAHRMFGLLSRAFNTELISLFLRSTDGRILRDYSLIEGDVTAFDILLAGHFIEPYLAHDQGVRLIADTLKEDFRSTHKDTRSMLIIPLKYRGQAIGVLIIESLRTDAFNQFDEHLMVVIASHLAGLIEYTRLREEAEGRARSLELIHEVVQQVIGLNEKKEVALITSKLVAQYFKFELAAIFLFDENRKFSIQGIGGTHAETVKHALAGVELILEDGVMSHVSRTGESILINDTRQDQLYKPLKGWEARSEICVALKDGETILGIIDVESLKENAFVENDLLAMESLAGILVSVITSANQYQKLQDTQKALLQAEKMAAAGRLSASIAHEINNPLQAVQNCLHLAGREDLPAEKRREYFELARTELERLILTVRRMLDFYRPGATAPQEVDLAEMLNYILNLMSKQLSESKVKVKLDFPSTIRPIMAVGSQIQQVFINLILNAMDAMSPTGGALDITARPSGDGVELLFRDHGRGIPLAQQANIFEPFFSTKDGGTGLGLTVSYNIIDKHKGTLELLPKRGSGACFRIFLPQGGKL